MEQEQAQGRGLSSWELRWRERIAAWRESGLSQQAFCRAHGLSESSFSRWKVELAKREVVPEPPAPAAKSPAGVSALAARSATERLGWTEVRWPRGGAEEIVAAPDSSGFEIVLPRGWSVRLGPRFEAEPLKRLLDVLEERSC